jgi:hypothetical protein
MRMPKERTNANREPARSAETGPALAGAARSNKADSDAILAAAMPALLHKAIDMAYDGNVAALQMSVKAALVSEQRRASQFDLPAPLGTFEGLAENSEAVVAAFSRGELTFEKAARIQAMLAAHRKFVVPGDKAAEDSEISGTAEDFLEPMRSLERATGFESKALEELKRAGSRDLQE